MASKSYTRYSTNPKMDTSGITAQQPQYGYGGMVGSADSKPPVVRTKTVTGGELYIEALSECDGAKRATTPDALRRVATLVSQGYSKDHAVDIVAEEIAYTPEGAED